MSKEGTNIRSSKESGSKSYISILEKMPLKRILRTIGVSSIFAFFISEILLLYFLGGGISRYPENLVVYLVVLSVGLGLEVIFFPPEISFLTSFTSNITLIFIVNHLFGSSTNPSILANYFSLSVEGQIVLDYLVIGLVGAPFWLIFLMGLYNFVRKTKKMSTHQAYLTFRTNLSHITNFFDEHPWLATIIVGAVTLLVGVLIGSKA